MLWVLFTFPSRYLSTIGLGRVFSLGGWARRIHAGFHVPRATQDASRLQSASRTGLSPSAGRLSRRFRSPSSCHILVLQPRRNRNPGGLGCSPVARHYWGNHVLFSLPLGTKMFQFPRFASTTRWMTVRQTAGLPHSGTSGSKAACASPELFAACRALHRLPEPQASAVRPFLLSPAPQHERCGAHTLELLFFLSELGIYSVFLFCSNMSMTERPVKGTKWRITDSNR